MDISLMLAGDEVMPYSMEEPSVAISAQDPFPSIPVDDTHLHQWANDFLSAPDNANSLIDGSSQNLLTDQELDTNATRQLEFRLDAWANGIVDNQDDTYSSSLDLASSAQVEAPATSEDDDGLTISDDDEVENLVCYGMIYQVPSQLTGNMSDLSSTISQLAQSSTASENAGVLKLSLDAEPNCIWLLLPSKERFGLVQGKCSLLLRRYISLDHLTLEAIVVLKDLQSRIKSSSRAKDAIVHVNINIYGPPGKASEIGDQLTTDKLWLQKPDHHQRRFMYRNPHVIHFPEVESLMQDDHAAALAGGESSERAAKDIQQLVQDMQASNHRAERLQGTTGDQRLKQQLLPHQEKALSFMIERESGDFPDEYRLWQPAAQVGNRLSYVHKITKTTSAERPDERGGGILADEMGMGKTLSTLALIIKTVQEGLEWARKSRNEEINHSDIQRHTHTTLVIVPSALLINTWMEEINMHLGDAVHIIKYHGQGRERNLDVLCRADIVLSTYKTLATDAGTKKSPLQKINWFRVVLDEAHNIRRPATTFHRACTDLQARSRWCLTGTPIQNGLEDIGALFVFLKTDEFKSLAQFRRFIVVPFNEGDAIAKTRLQSLYECLVLQQTKDLLDLPQVTETLRELTLSHAERRQYESTRKILARHLREQAGERENVNKLNLFQIHLRLRILCNHGTHENILSWNKRVRNADEREAFLAEFGRHIERSCAVCLQPRPIITSGNARCDFVEKCKHIICAECLGDLDGCRSADEAGGSEQAVQSEPRNAILRHCPLCSAAKRSVLAAPASGSRDNDDDVAMSNTPEDGLGDGSFRRDGHSTKIARLLADVKQALNETSIDESNVSRMSKSIVFSCWTRTLDLIGFYLSRSGIEYARIDGNSLFSKRRRVLDEFAGHGGPRVMLMTTGTGAYGLNLTAANHIFIVELQWNPSVEKQAIARAIRIRQKDKVKVTRYILADTVEQEMSSQQVNKRLAAQAGFKEQSSEPREDYEMEDLL